MTPEEIRESALDLNCYATNAIRAIDNGKTEEALYFVREMKKTALTALNALAEAEAQR